MTATQAGSICETGFFCMPKAGNSVCGDVVETRVDGTLRRLLVLSDGAGSGVKAHVAATIAANMGITLLQNDCSATQALDAVKRAMPDTAKQSLPYATLSVAEVVNKHRLRLMEYGNPPALLFENGSEKGVARQIHNGYANDFSPLTTCEIALNTGSLVVLVSDGISQAGTGSAHYPTGWGMAGLALFVENYLRLNPGVEAVELCRSVVAKANQIEHWQPADDMTCCAILVRKPRQMLVITGPPVDMANDGMLAQKVESHGGDVAICGGTTARIVAKGLGAKFSAVVPKNSTEGFPSQVKLVTEGALTLSRCTEMLEHPQQPVQPETPAAQLAAMLQANDHICILAGTRFNPANYAEGINTDVEMRRLVVKRLANVLTNKYQKTIEVVYL